MDNYSISVIPNQENKKSGKIELKGKLSIPYIQEIRSRLDKIIKNFDTIEIIVTDVSLIDLTMLQYLLSLKKSEKLLRKSLIISFKLNDELTELLEHAGFKY